MAQPSRRETEPSARRTELLAVAAREFARFGYAGTTVKRIADSAGILAGSLYHHFASKEAIFEELMRDLIDHTVLGYEQAIADVDALTAMERLIRHALQVIAERRDEVLVYQQERSYLSTNPKYVFVTRGSARMQQIWLETLQRGQSAGQIRPDVDVLVASRFIRDGIWSAVRWFRPGGPDSVDSLTGQFMGMLCSGIVAPDAASLRVVNRALPRGSELRT